MGEKDGGIRLVTVDKIKRKNPEWRHKCLGWEYINRRMNSVN